MKQKIGLFVIFSLFAYGLKAQTKPNIVLILADDMGYSDIGCYGGEIETPHIDRLATNGVRLLEFYNTGRCCPTRASLLTGQYPHNTGIGYMTGFDQNVYGYKGDLNKNGLTIAEALKPAGYTSFVSGKWHVCSNIQPEGNQSNWPMQRGFDGFFGILQGSASYFNPATLTIGNDLTKATRNFYLTDAISDSATAFINQQADNKNPFFLYVAYNAPHWPLHAKKNDIQKYMKLYEQGWDKLREERYKRQLKMGIIDPKTVLSPKDTVPAWNDIPEQDKKMWIKRMAIYAAQIDCMDQGIGRITDALNSNGLSENTMIIFMSDNGACAEYVSRAKKPHLLETEGTENSFDSYRGYWANLSNTPFRLYKTRVHEGGIHTPFIISWPGHTTTNGSILDNQPVHVIDLLPTFLAAGGIKYPTNFKGNPLNPLNGIDISKVFLGKKTERNTLYWEHEGNRAIRDGKWKLVSKSKAEIPYESDWELYDLSADKTELHNLMAKYPAKAKELESKWLTWANANHVFPLNGTGMQKRAKAFPREH
ncbi:MAG: arylsulfatase [Sphingobacteriales bacterium]|jgi:arylsulfatase A-like enzyme|nr:arylsulfatase [Sphingobacteriales bacterium]